MRRRTQEMHASVDALPAARVECFRRSAVVCLFEKRGSPAPSIVGVMPYHPGVILKRLSHARGSGARELGTNAFIARKSRWTGHFFTAPARGTHECQRQTPLMLSKA